MKQKKLVPERDKIRQSDKDLITLHHSNSPPLTFTPPRTTINLKH